jgi:hypothetical protein
MKRRFDGGRQCTYQRVHGAVFFSHQGSLLLCLYVGGGGRGGADVCMCVWCVCALAHISTEIVQDLSIRSVHLPACASVRAGTWTRQTHKPSSVLVSADKRRTAGGPFSNRAPECDLPGARACSADVRQPQ